MSTFNRQYMGTSGAFAATSVLFPPQASIRTAATSGVNDPEAPVTVMRAAPNPNEIWRLSAGEILKVFLFDAAGNPLPQGEVYIGKKLLGGQGTRWYTVQPSDILPTKVQAVDINNAFRSQQTIRIHAGEELVLAVNDGGTAWDPTQAANQIQIPYEVAAGVTPAQNAVSLRRWG